MATKATKRLQLVDNFSAYKVAVKNGFEGTEAEWLESLRGEPGYSGVHCGPDEPTDPTVNLWIKPDGNPSADGEAYSVKTYGAMGDGVTDDTDAINACVANHNLVYIPDGTYLINGSTSINLKSYQTLELADNAVLKVYTANENASFCGINIDNATNVIVRGGKICGDKSEYADSTNEKGRGIRVYNSSNITIQNCEIYDHRGDCVSILTNVASADDYETYVCRDIQIKDCRIHDAHRHGVTVSGVRGLTIKDVDVYNVTGCTYSCAIDVEVHANYQEMSDFRFERVREYDNATNGINFNTKNIASISGCYVKSCELSRLACPIYGEVMIIDSTICTLVTSRLDKLNAINCIINTALMANGNNIDGSVDTVIFDHCVFNGLESNEGTLVSFVTTSSDDMCVKHFEANNCTFNTLQYNTQSSTRRLFSFNHLPKTLVLNNCTFNVNNPEVLRFYASDLVRIYGCQFTRKFTIDTNPPPCVTISAEKMVLIYNVYDGFQTEVTNPSDAYVIQCQKGDLVFANNTCVGTETVWNGIVQALPRVDGDGNTYASSFIIANNVFNGYSGLNDLYSTIVCTDVGNIYTEAQEV